MENNGIPLVLFTYNRPKLFKQLIPKLDLSEVECVIIFVDGPKNPEDLERVEACRRIATEITGVPKELHFHETNLGLPGFLDNIHTVMESHQHAIFLEDDCHPVPGFYQFMKQALLHYQFETQVFSICAYQPLPKGYFKDFPYALVSSNRFICWGWATWQDRWREFEEHLDSYTTFFNHLKDVPEDAGPDIPTMARSIFEHPKNVSWDIPVSLIALWLNKSHLIASRGLVKNVGKVGGIHGSYSNLLRQWFFHNKNIINRAWRDPYWLEDVNINFAYSHALNSRIQQIQNTSIRRLVCVGRGSLKHWFQSLARESFVNSSKK